MIKPGDKITCKGFTVTVDKIDSQTDYGTDDQPDHYIEFYDTNGYYHYWKQSIDGGHITFLKDAIIVLVFEDNEKADAIAHVVNKELNRILLDWLDDVEVTVKISFARKEQVRS